MSLADKLVSSFLAFELDIDIQSPIHAKRTNALKEFEKLGFPTKKDEAWKYTCLLYTSPSPRDATLSRMPSSA